MSKGSCNLNILIIVFFLFGSGGPAKFMITVRFSSSINGNDLFRREFCLIHDQYGMGLIFFFRINLLHIGCFGNRDEMAIFLRYF